MADREFKPVRHDYKALLERACKRVGFAEAYDALEMGFALARELPAAGSRAGLTQEAVAARRSATQRAISRMESAGMHAPLVASLKGYAAAVGCPFKIELVPQQRKVEKANPPSRRAWLHKHWRAVQLEPCV